MTINKVLAESFNNAIDNGFNSYLEAHATSENCEIKIDEEKLVADIENEWLNTQLEPLGNRTPGEYINTLTTLDQLLALFLDIASVSDVGVPDVLLEKLKAYDSQASEELFKFITHSMEQQDPDRVFAVAQAVYAIGCLRVPEYKEKLIRLLFDCFRDELISEAICAAIVEYDKDILEDIIKAFHAVQQPEVQEYLFTCVAEISKENKSDEIFQFLKNAFRIVSNLKLAVEVLGDYGDGRAIPLLRGYILKNIKEMDKSTFNHIRAVIKKLGGEIDDLSYNN